MTVAGFSLVGDAGGNSTATGTSGPYTGLGARCYFYNWNITMGVAATPLPTVNATVNTIPTPTFTTSPATSLCIGNSATYTTQSGQSSYAWSVPGISGTDYTITSGGTGSASNTVTLTWLTAGSKTVTVNYSNAGCTGTTPASSTTTVNTQPVPTFATSPSTNTCAGSSVTYTTQAGQSSYAWSVPGVSGTNYTITSGGTGTGSNTVTLTWITAGSKTVTVNYANSNGCTGASAATNTTTVNAVPVPTFTVSPGANTCANSSVTYTTQAGQSSYVWSVPGVSGTDYTITSGGTGSTSNTVTLTWLTTGSKTVTVNYTNANLCTGASAASITTSVNALPVPTFTSSPSANTCAGSGVTYTTQAGQSAYAWTVPGVPGTNYTITSGSTGTGSNTVTLTWITAGSETVTVNYTNANSCTGASAASAVTTVNAVPVPTFTSSPLAGVCVNTSVTYTTQSAQLSYNWAVPGVAGTDYTITSGGTGSTSNTVTLTWLTAGSKTVTVNYSTAGCTGTTPASSTTTVNALPVPTFTSSAGANTCVSASVTYTTQAGQHAYVWSVPGVLGTDYAIVLGGTGSGNSTVTLTWLTAGSKTVTINYTNTNGCTSASPASNTTTVNAQPVPTFTSSPGANSCANYGVTYTTQVGASNYIWSVPGVSGTDYTITSGGTGSGSNTVTLNWLTLGSQTVTVNYTLGCTGAVPASNTTTVNAPPTPTFTSSPTASTCAGSSVTYTTQAGQSSYSWSLPGGSGTDYIITSGGTGSGSNTVTVTWMTPGRKIVTVNYTDINGCTGLSAASAATTVNMQPIPTFTSSPGAGICANSSAIYTTQAGQSSYNWSVSGTAGVDYVIMSGGTGSGDNTVTLTWITPGNQSVTVNYTDINGCTGASPASNTILVNPLPGGITGPGQVCITSSVTLTDGTSGGSWSSSNSAVAEVDPVFGIVTGISVSTATVTYTLPSGCMTNAAINVNPLPSAITGNTAVCVGSTTELFDPGGGTWSSSDETIATIDSSLGVVTGIFEGSPTITYTLPTGCIATTLFSVNQLPSGISGITNACTGATTSLSNSLTGKRRNRQCIYGGTWTSSNTSNATVNIISGVVTGVNAGTPTITYTLPTGCIATTNFTVNPTPAAISGIGVECAGASLTLTEISTGGTWSSSDATLASVSGGIVSGIASGNPTITYTLPAGCFVTKSILVNPLPSAIGGITTVCSGLTTSLNDTNFGGAWSSSNTSFATIGTSSGIVTGVAAGAVSITYSLATSCSITTTVTVNPLARNTGVTHVCAGANTTLSNSVTGGAWSSSNSSIATVNTLTGAITGLAGGLPTITYTTPAGCIATTPITVNPTPPVNLIAGGGSICSGRAGAAISLSSSVTGINYQLFDGITGIGAPLPGTGGPLYFGLHTVAGIYTIIATNSSSGCFDTMSGTATIIVNPLPAVFTVIGGGDYCAGAGGPHIGLSGSNTGINYQLFYGITHVGAPLAGTGIPLDFGPQTLEEVYTVVAINGSTGCTDTMAGGAPVVENPLPALYSVTGGGNYCSGGTGVHIGLDGSNSGINYQLFTGGGMSGLPLSGASGPVDFGLRTAAGVYKVTATNAATGCTSNMLDSATVVIDPALAPAITLSTGVGDTVCSGHLITITTAIVNGGSAPLYSWSINRVSTGTSGASYTYLPSDGDVIMAELTSSAGCATPASVSSSFTLSVFGTGAPSVHITASPGDTICNGTLVHFTATPLFGGTSPSLSWVINSSVADSGADYYYRPASGDVIYCVLGSNYQCRTSDSATSNHISMTVAPSTPPVVTITGSPGSYIARGQSDTLYAHVTNGGPDPSYQWYLNGSPVSGAIYPEFVSSNLSNGDTLKCEVTSSGICNGITASASDTIHVSNVGVPNIVSEGSDIRLLPNPNTGLFTIKGTLGTTGDELVTLVITDMLGQVIYNSQVMAADGKIDVQVTLASNLANGMYLLNIHSASQNDVLHFVIEK